MIIKPQRHNIIKYSKGITLLEVMLAIAIIVIISTFSIPVYQTFTVKNELSLTTSFLVEAIRRAQVYSQAVSGDSSWGVNVSGSTITLFKGNNYVSRDDSYDENYTLSQEITPSGLSEIVFSRFDGLPSSTGTITLTTSGGEFKNININEKGTLEY